MEILNTSGYRSVQIIAPMNDDGTSVLRVAFSSAAAAALDDTSVLTTAAVLLNESHTRRDKVLH